MQVIKAIDTQNVNGTTKRLFDAVTAQTGAVPNMIKTMAQSPGALQGYLQFSEALAGSVLDPRLREKIALAVAQADHCEYSLAYHTASAKSIGISESDILNSRDGHANDAKTGAALRFAQDLALRSEEYSVEDLRKAGFGDREIVDILACVALSTFTDQLNLVAKPEIDSPAAASKLEVA